MSAVPSGLADWLALNERSTRKPTSRPPSTTSRSRGCCESSRGRPFSRGKAMSYERRCERCKRTERAGGGPLEVCWSVALNAWLCLSCYLKGTP